MEQFYLREMRYWFTSLVLQDRDKKVNQYIELFPELKSRLSKFGIGILQWELKGLINIKNPDDVSRVRLILRVLDQTPGFDFFDNSFNEAEPDTVCQILGISEIKPNVEPPMEFDYCVSYIPTYEEALRYKDMVSWCIVISEESFNLYTANGNRFYFCGNGEWWDVSCVPGMSFPCDRFGYSLIAVEMTPDNKIASITSRWNTFGGDSSGFITETELKEILKEKYQNLFI